MPKPPACPICGKPTAPEFAPFCGRGCKDRDLLKWLGEGYRLPAGPADENPPVGLDSADEPD
jgi:endogenous inhibitor of DNA gyrase (YacG/DUF329 family)